VCNHRFCARTPSEQRLWLRSLINVKMKLMCGVPNPTNQQVAGCRSVVPQQMDLLKTPEANSEELPRMLLPLLMHRENNEASMETICYEANLQQSAENSQGLGNGKQRSAPATIRWPSPCESGPGTRRWTWPLPSPFSRPSSGPEGTAKHLTWLSRFLLLRTSGVETTSDDSEQEFIDTKEKTESL